MKVRTSAAFLIVLCCASALHAQDGGCNRSGDVSFVCGPKNAEDLVLVPRTQWILASGMAPGAGFSLIDSRSPTASPLQMRAEHDAAAFPDCETAPQASTFDSHGLNIRAGRGDRSTLYVVGHGAREAIEVFEIDASGARPSLTWKGCVPMPPGLAANSVASFEDGSIVATVLFRPGTTFADAVVDKKPTGAVYKWSPGDRGFTLIRGTELPANNGIEVSADGSEIYVASSGLQTVVAFSNTNPATRLRSTEPLPFTPDNVHMDADGRLLTAGMKNDVPECGGAPGPQHDIETLSRCPRPSIAIAIDPATMRYTTLVETPAIPAFSNATMALTVGNQYWIGTFSGDRVAYGTLDE
jgi:hypothetical protein